MHYLLQYYCQMPRYFFVCRLEVSGDACKVRNILRIIKPKSTPSQKQVITHTKDRVHLVELHVFVGGLLPLNAHGVGLAA